MWKITGNRNEDMLRSDFDSDCVALDENGFEVDIDDIFGARAAQEQLADAGYGDRESRRILIWASEEDSIDDPGTHSIASATWGDE